MTDAKIINALNNHVAAINKLNNEFKAMQKVLDKTYVQSLTHVMMWDVLFSLLQEKGIMTKEQFDTALQALSDKTKATMEAEQEKKKLPAEGKVAVLSQEPAIPVVK